MGLRPVIRQRSAHLDPLLPGCSSAPMPIGVMLGAPLMTATTGRVPRRTLLIGLAGIFTLGNLLSAIADNYVPVPTRRAAHHLRLNHGAASWRRVDRRGKPGTPRAPGGRGRRHAHGPDDRANVVGVPLAATWGGDALGWCARPSGASAALGALRRWPHYASRCRTPQRPGEWRRRPRNCVCWRALPCWRRSASPCSAPARCSPYSPTSRRSCRRSRTPHLGFDDDAGDLWHRPDGRQWLGGRYADRSVDRTL